MNITNRHDAVICLLTGISAASAFSALTRIVERDKRGHDDDRSDDNDNSVNRLRQYSQIAENKRGNDRHTGDDGGYLTYCKLTLHNYTRFQKAKIFSGKSCYFADGCQSSSERIYASYW